MHARRSHHLILKEHSFTSQSGKLHKGVGFPATAHCTVESSYLSGQLSVCHLSSERLDVTLLTNIFCLNVFSAHLSALCLLLYPRLNTLRLGLKSDFISTLHTDWYRFTSRYIGDVLMVRLSLCGHCGNK